MADLTLTPWLGIGPSDTIELRYRQAFRRGDLTIDGAISWDDLTDDTMRGYVFAEGRFDLRRDFVLDFELQGVSDRGYLTTYGFPDPDLNGKLHPRQPRQPRRVYRGRRDRLCLAARGRRQFHPAHPGPERRDDAPLRAGTARRHRHRRGRRPSPIAAFRVSTTICPPGKRRAATWRACRARSTGGATGCCRTGCCLPFETVRCMPTSTTPGRAARSAAHETRPRPFVGRRTAYRLRGSAGLVA